jgi:predicted nucleotidyltransferase component of viral defense system
MIPRADIIAWKEHAPWPLNEQVEQDLVISRASVEIYSDDFLKQRLAFRGGTALHKIYLKPAARYSEDIDLVQITAEPIGPTLDRLRERLDFLGKPKIKQGDMMTTMIYRFDSEIAPVVPMKLKVEINCREHFTVDGYKTIPFKVDTNWYKGECELVTFSAEELLSTKLRALYQRKQGRDLFDLHHSMKNHDLVISKIITGFTEYIKRGGHEISKEDYLKNMEEKLNDDEFQGDIASLLRPQIEFEFDEAWKNVRVNIIEKLENCPAPGTVPHSRKSANR